jgi:cytochrome c556
LATALGTADDAVLAAVATLQTSVDALPTNAELATALGTADDAVLTQVALVKTETDKIAAVKAKTDSLTFTVAGQVDANIQAVNDTAIQGTGAVGSDEWRAV